LLARELDSALEEEKQITEFSEGKRSDGEIYKILSDEESQKKIHLFSLGRNTMAET